MINCCYGTVCFGNHNFFPTGMENFFLCVCAYCWCWKSRRVVLNLAQQTVVFTLERKIVGYSSIDFYLIPNFN